MSLLSNPITNYKAKKNLSLKVDTYFLSLAHSNTSGYNVCPVANKIGENNANKSNCSLVCLAKNGNGNYPNVIESRITKTKRFFEDRQNFLNELVVEIYKSIEKSRVNKNTPTFSLNA